MAGYIIFLKKEKKESLKFNQWISIFVELIYYHIFFYFLVLVNSVMNGNGIVKEGSKVVFI